MEHIIIVYPTGFKQLSKIQKALQQNGKIINEKTIELNGSQAFGYLMNFYWNPEYLDLKSIRDKVRKSGWKNTYAIEPLTMIIWKSSSKKVSQNLLDGSLSKFKCYLRWIAYSGQETKWEDFEMPSPEECRLWKGSLHSPDNLDENQRLIPLFFHDSTAEWMKLVPWEEVLPNVVNWMRKFNRKNGNLEWDSTGKLVETKNNRGENGVYWDGYWMSVPPINKNQWNSWIQDSLKGEKQKGGNFLWSHPATLESEDLKTRKKSDYLMSWKADGLHGILVLEAGKWKILNEKGEVSQSGLLTEEGKRMEDTRWEGEYLPEKKEFLAFDMPTEEKRNYQERIKRAEMEWSGKKKTDVLWQGIPISHQLTLLWKPFKEVKDIDEYLKTVEEMGYDSDGLIFMPMSIAWRDFGKGDGNKILKWKPGRDQTVDVYIYGGKVWLKDYNPKRIAPMNFNCGGRQGRKKNYPREWTFSRLSPRNAPKVEWKDGTEIGDHNDEIWEIRWKTTVNENAPNYIWEAVRRRDSNKEILLKNSGGLGAICDGRFVGPNAWRTMESVENALLMPVRTIDLEKW